MMRKVFISMAFILATNSLFAGGFLKQSTATTINIGPFTKIADGSLENSATITGISVSLIKKSATLSSTVTTVSLAASGSDNDGVFVAKGTYNMELSAANTDTLYTLDVVATYTGCYPVTDSFTVVDATKSSAFLIEGDIGSGADIPNLLLADMNTAGSWGKLLKDNLDAATSTALTDAALAELAQGVPPATPTMSQAVMALYMALRNTLQTSGGAGGMKKFTNDAGTVVYKKALSYDAPSNTYTEAEAQTGP